MSTLPRTFWTNPTHFIASGLGFGTLPWMPGTWATLATVPIYLVLQTLPVFLYIGIVILMVLIGVYVCGITNRDLGTDDHPACAWDEMATFPITLIGIPLSWPAVILAVILFRIFDIWKPWPIRWVDQNIHGGWGVMLDDVIAALVTLFILSVLFH